MEQVRLLSLLTGMCLWAFDWWLTETGIPWEGNTEEAPGKLLEPRESIGKECQHSP